MGDNSIHDHYASLQQNEKQYPHQQQQPTQQRPPSKSPLNNLPRRCISPFRSRGKSQSPRVPSSATTKVVSNGKPPNGSSASSKSERSSFKESGEHFKKMLIRKLTPWRKVSTGVGTSPRNSIPKVHEQMLSPAAQGDHEIALPPT